MVVKNKIVPQGLKPGYFGDRAARLKPCPSQTRAGNLCTVQNYVEQNKQFACSVTANQSELPVSSC
jgi:hypothetical protein